MEPDEPGDWKAALDQAKAGMIDIADALGTYRSSLLQAGFEAEEALALVRDYQQMLLAMGAQG